MSRRTFQWTTVAVALVLVSVAPAAADYHGLYEVDGNPSCGNLYEATVTSGPAGSLAHLGPLFGLKYDANPTGDVSSTFTDNAPWVVTNGPQDPNNTVSIFNVVLSDGEGVQFDWSSTLGLDAVIVKAQDSNAYVYHPEAFSASGLTAPDGRAVSHVEFCYDYELDVDKNAAGQFDKDIDWTLEKTVAPETHSGFIGDSFSSTWTVAVTRNDTPINYRVVGTITIVNPSPAPVSFSVADVIDDSIDATVDCDGVSGAPYDPTGTVAGGGTATCEYFATATDGINGTQTLNEAEVTSLTEGVEGGTATAGISFTFSGTYYGDEEVTLDDDRNPSGFPADISAGTTVTYNETFTCSTNQGDYTNGVDSDNYPNTATLKGDETDLSSSADVDVTCYIPQVEKNVQTAPRTYNYEWTIDKTPDEDYVDFIGDPKNDHQYSIEVTRLALDDDSIVASVGGLINVSNPTGAPASITVNVADALNDLTVATVDCDGTWGDPYTTSLTVAAGTTGTCAYEAIPPNDDATTNTATVTFKTYDFTDSEDVVWDVPIENNPEVNITDDYGTPGNLADDKSWGPTTGGTFTYPREFKCPTSPDAYTDGKYEESVTNTAEIEETDQYDTATVTLTCYAPVVTKDAAGSYDERHTWDIQKSVDPTSQSKFIGETANWIWTVDVTEESIDENFLVSGSITVANGHPTEDMNLTDLTDAVDGVSADVTCASLVVPAGGTLVCTYEATEADGLNGDEDLNTATAEFNTLFFSGEKAFTYVKTVINGTAVVDDDQESDFPVTLTAGQGSWQWTENDSGDCSTDTSLYAGDGTYQFGDSNTAVVTGSDGQTDQASASTTVDCYAPVVTKDAAGSYDERHTWDIAKSVDPESQSGYPGDLLDWTWTVDVTESSNDENFLVSGSITVANGHPTEDMLLTTLTDAVDGVSADVTCASLVVPAGGTLVCTYEATEADGLDGDEDLNTATAEFNTLFFSGEKAFTYVKTVINGTADVDDDQESDFPVTLTAGQGPWEYTETQDHTCSSDWVDYEADGTYSETLYNTATVEGSDGQTDSADAETTYTCEAGKFQVLKWTDGVVDPTYDWQFAVYEGPDGYNGGAQVGQTDSTLGDADGILDFGDPVPALAADQTYTVCELNVPAGWSSEWSIEGVTVIPYNPNAADTPPQDLGQRCFDFGAGTSYPVEVGLTLEIKVDNTFPGGNPRTPGYWKNWNSCSDSQGNQYEKTIPENDPENEYISLDEVLNDPGIAWCDFIIAECFEAYLILDDRINDGKRYPKSSKYGANTLAKHLLAYQVNEGAGACKPLGDDAYVLGTSNEFYAAGTPCPAGSDAASYGENCDTLGNHAAAAEQLLCDLGFDGTEGLLRPKDADYWTALDLAMVLDMYNNGAYCGDFDD